MKPRTLSIDIETFSSVDLVQCGVYRYVESDDFDVLLFGYSLDYGPVRVIDSAQDEVIPAEIIDYVFDPTVEKTAFNANFERTCLSKYFGRYCEPEQWSCTMVLAASCGLPMTLAGVGKALELPEDKAKMKEGKDLIKYFCQPCKPTKVNGQRTRNLPEHAPEKWEVFKAYNARDVEVENTIRKMLLKWRPGRTEHKLWCLDQRMNDKGVRIEPLLAENAIKIGNAYREELIEQAKVLSGLENPNSAAQIKQWLEEQEGVEVLSLNKKAIADVYASLSTEETKEVLRLREEFSKSSTKKYEKFLLVKCQDDHIRGTFQFYGASTGRWCLTGDHEVLTPFGWVRLDEWLGGDIACWNLSTSQISFQKSEALQFDYTGEMVKINQQRCSQISTPDHKTAYTIRGHLPWRESTIGELYGKRFNIPFTGKRDFPSATDPVVLRILIMVQADGHYAEDGTLRLRFRKKRKIDRCKYLLRKSGIVHSEFSRSDDSYEFIIPIRHQPVWLRSFRDKTFGWWMLDEDPRVIVEEIELWDGYRGGPNSIQYSTTNKHNADVIQAVCQLGGYSSTLLMKSRDHRKENWSDAYYVNIWLTPGLHTEIRSEHQSKINYSGKVYCASTPTGYFLVRREGKVWITGNSGRSVQLQNLPHDTLPDLDTARDMALIGDPIDFECLYPKVQSALSALIRTTLIPEENSRFIVADFSAIEARVIAWIAKEEWRIKAFENNEDIYCASASKAFKVPVVKHGINGELRAKGKIIELACIAEGQLVLTDRGLVPIQNVTTDMKVWDGDTWVEHDGVVYKGVQYAITYQGLTATPDHMVYLTDRRATEPVMLGYAACAGEDLKDGMYPANHSGTYGTGFGKVKVYDIANAGPNHRYTVSGKLVHNCGFGGSVGAMKNFGADKMGMTEEEMIDLVDKWREASPHIVSLWKSLENSAIKCLKQKKSTVSSVGSIRFDLEDGVMWMTLPSGRRISYWGADIGQDRWGRPSLTYMTLNQTTKKWERTETFGGKLTENCVSGMAFVLTDSGFVRLKDLPLDSKVWDGEEFVSHEGRVCKGFRICVAVDGVAMTPDHRVMTEGGWINATDCGGLDRIPVRLPKGVRPVGRFHDGSSKKVAGTMPVWNNKVYGYWGHSQSRKTWFSDFLRMYEKAVHRGKSKDTRNDQASRIRRMAFDGPEVYGTDAQGMEELRGSWDTRLRKVASQLRKFLGGHVINISARIGLGSNRQRRGLFSGELSLDYEEKELPEQAKHAPVIRWYNSKGLFGKVRSKLHDAFISYGPWSIGRFTVDTSRCYEPVYDIVNCGPRHRFVVFSNAGPMVVHNCVQATARDCLKEALFNLDKAGYDVRATIHDEVIITAPNDFGSLEDVIQLMCKGAPWMEGLPLNADGYYCSSYRKD